ncbi:MAG: LegC family aminotransferase [Deltaproteobacteria bacterium]|nr:LegC family aminotransferase [Deltaproteobacteria bacterium]
MSEDIEKKIPLSSPEISGNEWSYIKECLDTGWVSSAGEYVSRFEKMMAEYVGGAYAVSTVNGTSALHISLVALGVSPQDEVIVPALTFIAPVNAVRYCGASPVFMDCDPETLCIDISKFTEFIERECFQRSDGFTCNRTTKKRIKAVIPVHVFGHPARMDELIKICSQRNIDIIEDATESLGSELNGKKTGSFGLMACFSFNGNKIITTGGGGMVLTGDRDRAARIKHLTTQAKSDSFEYDHDDIGYNYRLTNVQAAIGVAQMERIDEFVLVKRRNALLYKNMLSGLQEVDLVWESQGARSNFWFYTLKAAKEHKAGLMETLLARGIQVRPLWKPLTTLRMYQNYQNYFIEQANEAYETCFNLPCSVSLSEQDIAFVTNAVKDYFKR